MNETVANSSALTTVGLVATNWLDILDKYAQIAANIVAIVAGLLAAWYYIEKVRASRRISKKD